MSYQFGTDWFEINALNVWNSLIPTLDISKILEVGAFEGAATTYLIEKCGNKKDLEIHCIDTWDGGEEHGNVDMKLVEDRFDGNIARAKTLVSKDVNLIKHKDYSSNAMPKLIAEGHAGTFDFIYIDGSHQAPDVLLDAVLGFKLLKVGGVMVFDDYTWRNDLTEDITHIPKPAIDAFTSLYWNKILPLRAVISQIYIKKTKD